MLDIVTYERGKFNERDGVILMKQLLTAVNYFHEKNVVHR